MTFGCNRWSLSYAVLKSGPDEEKRLQHELRSVGYLKKVPLSGSQISEFLHQICHCYRI